MEAAGKALPPRPIGRPRKRFLPYLGYTACVAIEPSYYGSECSADDAARIAGNLRDMLLERFPGITVEESENKTTGPDAAVVDEINQWVQENWTAALL
jgi:hypothetical protein